MDKMAAVSLSLKPQGMISGQATMEIKKDAVYREPVT